MPAVGLQLLTILIALHCSSLANIMQMNDLYRLYVSNTEMPAKYSTLLQLRELLDIKEDQAESLEQEVLGSSSSFSI